MHPIRIDQLSAEEHAELDHANRSAKDGRLRIRALIVLLAAERGLVAADIAAVVRMHEETVRRWLVRYQAEGLEGLTDAPRSGAPPRITRAYRDRLLAVVRRRPRTLDLPFSLWTGDRLADYLAEQTGLRASKTTVYRLLRAGGVYLNCPQHTITSPDPEYARKKLGRQSPLEIGRGDCGAQRRVLSAEVREMARLAARPAADAVQVLAPVRRVCWACSQPMWVAYHSRRTVVTLRGLIAYRLVVRRCETPECPAYHQPYRPEVEGRLALPQAEIGLDVIALVGQLRFAECRSVPEIHRSLLARGVDVAERTVTNLVARYEELVALALADAPTRTAALRAQGAIVLALDGLQPDVGHEVLWVLRDVLTGTILLARSLLGATAGELVALLREVVAALPSGVGIRGVVSDGQHSIRKAVRIALPGVPHQLCHFHYLREAGLPIYEADRHAKKELKKQVRGVRPIERLLEGRTDPVAEAVRGYCQAVRSAITDDGRPPLAASGLQLQQRLTAIHASLTRVANGVAKGGGHRRKHSPVSPRS